MQSEYIFLLFYFSLYLFSLSIKANIVHSHLFTTCVSMFECMISQRFNLMSLNIAHDDRRPFTMTRLWQALTLCKNYGLSVNLCADSSVQRVELKSSGQVARAASYTGSAASCSVCTSGHIGQIHRAKTTTNKCYW